MPNTIDQVVIALDAVVADAIQTQSRLGYFAALYNRVTMAVRAGIRAGTFQDPARMERLDVAFANRYLAAHDRFLRGATPPASWRLAFEAGTRLDLSVMQHLLLGINAHINLDLGVACAEIAPGAAIDALEGDFNRINDLLASLLPEVELQLISISHLLGVTVDIADHFDDLDGRIGNFSIAEARRSAWRFARILARLGGPVARNVAITARDQEIALLAFKLQQPGPFSIVLGGADWTNIAAHIRILSQASSGIANA